MNIREIQIDWFAATESAVKSVEESSASILYPMDLVC
jgi:hypothetical protein